LRAVVEESLTACDLSSDIEEYTKIITFFTTFLSDDTTTRMKHSFCTTQDYMFYQSKIIDLLLNL